MTAQPRQMAQPRKSELRQTIADTVDELIALRQRMLWADAENKRLCGALDRAGRADWMLAAAAGWGGVVGFVAAKVIA